MDHRWRAISIQQKQMKLNNHINFITEDSTHEVPEASRGPSESKASNNIISFRENGCQSVWWRAISIQQKQMKLNNHINFITEDSTHEVPEASRGPSASKASNNIISFRENGCQSVFSRYVPCTLRSLL